jgi:uncharacterized protein YqfB (UPF0267 family)
MTRLTEAVAAGATTISVEDEVDWQVGDELYLAPTSFSANAGEYAVISAIDATTITLETVTTNYHYGAAESTAVKYNDLVDIRGEVVNMSRNVKIVEDSSQPSEDWGGQIVCGDTIDISGAVFTCNLIMDNVELF